MGKRGSKTDKGCTARNWYTHLRYILRTVDRSRAEAQSGSRLGLCFEGSVKDCSGLLCFHLGRLKSSVASRHWNTDRHAPNRGAYAGWGRRKLPSYTEDTDRVE